MNTARSATPLNTQGSNYPAGYGDEAAHQGVYDKPADRRLAPWITLGSLLLLVCLILSMQYHHKC